MLKDTLLISPDDPADLGSVARKLLAAAGDPSEVATDTSGRSMGFRVSRELAKKAGFDVDEDAAVAADNGTADALAEPPRTGAGSGKDRWREFLTAAGVAFDASDDREDLQAIWDAHGKV